MREVAQVALEGDEARGHGEEGRERELHDKVEEAHALFRDQELQKGAA